MMNVSGVYPTITTACVDFIGSEEQLPSYTRPRCPKYSDQSSPACSSATTGWLARACVRSMKGLGGSRLLLDVRRRHVQLEAVFCWYGGLGETKRPRTHACGPTTVPPASASRTWMSANSDGGMVSHAWMRSPVGEYVMFALSRSEANLSSGALGQVLASGPAVETAQGQRRGESGGREGRNAYAAAASKQVSSLVERLQFQRHIAIGRQSRTKA